MLINILQKNGDLYDLSWKEDQILEIYHVDHKPADLLRLCVYDPASNTLEEIAKNEEYSIFKYYLRPTFDFIQEILWNGEDMEVLEPLWLRKEIAGKIKRMWNKYSEDR